MRKKRLFLLLSLLAAAWLFADALRGNYLLLGGRIIPRNATVLAIPGGSQTPEKLRQLHHLRWLDLRGEGISLSQCQAQAEAAPQSRVVWELDFQQQTIPATAREINLTHLDWFDLPVLDALTKLERIDGSRCTDYPQLLALAARRPECRVHYAVALGGSALDCEDCLLCPGMCSRRQLRQALSYLPHARQVDLRSTGLSQTDCMALADSFPGIRFLWDAQIGEHFFPTDSRMVDLSGVPMEDSREIEALLPYLPEVEKVVLCDCGIPSPDMAALDARYPDIRFVWRVKLGPLSARTDDKWFAPITKRQLIGGHDADELKYCTDMECIDLGHCWIRDCEWARNMKNLKYLVLADTYVTDLSPLSELKHLAYLELFVTPVRDYSPLLGCTGLEDLNLGYTYGDPTPICQMQSLKNLWWGGIGHVPWVSGQSPANMLRSSLPNTRITLYSGSSTALGWRQLPHYYEMRDRIGMYYMSG